jgi:hypothetical protein
VPEGVVEPLEAFTVAVNARDVSCTTLADEADSDVSVTTAEALTVIDRMEDVEELKLAAPMYFAETA